MKNIIAVDFDGTLAVHKYPDIGDEVDGAIEACLNLQESCKLILYTMRAKHWMKLLNGANKEG